MKFISFLLVGASLLLSGCSFFERTDDPYAKSDFQPIQAQGSVVEDGDERPLNSTLATAISSDELTFAPTDNWITDQAHLPDAVIDKKGHIFLYYSGWIVGNDLDRTAVAISQDNGKTWVYKKLTITGGEAYSLPQAVDVVYLPEGTFRLYYTAHAIDFIGGLHYAESQDGLNFVYKGTVFVPTGYEAKNSTTFKIGDTWHLYAVSEEGPQALWHLTSSDGVAFEVYAKTSFPMDGESVLPANGTWVDDTFHLFVSTSSGTIKSWSTKNGYDWYPDDGVRLSPQDGHTLVKDPTIVELKDGSRLMIYVTDIID
ncbi:hypothetical protein HZA87_04910 [Candidatus Uhrbacteria bacterium]|nr:hypothetical protein [Candidatus Uhrbacteria bacterium]